MESLGFVGGSIGGSYYNDPMALQQAKAVGPLTMKQRLDMAVQEAENRLAAAKRAREIFDAHPELEELLNIMQRMHF